MPHAGDDQTQAPSATLFIVEAVVRALMAGMSLKKRARFVRDLSAILDQYEEAGRITAMVPGFTAQMIVTGRREAAERLRPVVAMMGRKVAEERAA